MNGWRLLSVIFLLHSAQGRHIGRISSRRGDVAQETAQDTLKRLIQFYRSQDSGMRGSSVEGPESRELEISPELPTFRIDLSNGNAGDDMVPFAEDVPIGSIETAPKITIFQESDEPPSQDAIVPNLNNGPEPEQPPPQPPVVVNPEEAEIAVTTMFPISLEGMNISQIIIPQHDQSPADDEAKDGDEDEDEEDSEEECKEGETKKLRCNNSCVCVDGAFFCSKRKCGGSAKPGNATVNPALALKVGSGEIPKKPWGFRKKDPNATPLPTCSSGMTKSIDCNQCICVMGKWACTKRGCIALTFREKASYTDGVSLYNQVETLTENKNIDEDCSEGGTRQMDCNQCICHLNSWSCSNFPCGPTPPPKKAPEILEACQKEGDVKSRGCNLCKCTHGTWVCSDNDCNAFEDKDISIPAFRTSTKVNRKPKFPNLDI